MPIAHRVRTIPKLTILVGLALSSGCVSPGVNTDNPSTFDMVFRQGQLNSHLEARRARLEDLRIQLEQVDQRLSSELTDLGALQGQLANLEGSRQAQEKEIGQLMQEIADSYEAGVEIRKRRRDLSEKREALLVSIDQTIESNVNEREEQERQEAALSADIEQLSREIAFWETTNVRLRETRARMVTQDTF